VSTSDRAEMSYICPGCKVTGEEKQGFAVELSGANIRKSLRVVRITCRRCGMQVFWNSELKDPRWVQVA